MRQAVRVPSRWGPGSCATYAWRKVREWSVWLPVGIGTNGGNSYFRFAPQRGGRDRPRSALANKRHGRAISLAILARQLGPPPLRGGASCAGGGQTNSMSEKRANLEVVNGVARRIQRFLAGLEHARRQPNRREAYHICMAMEYFQSGKLAESEDSLRRADRLDPVPPDIATQTAYNKTPTLAELQIALDQLRPN